MAEWRPCSCPYLNGPGGTVQYDRAPYRWNSTVQWDEINTTQHSTIKYIAPEQCPVCSICDYNTAPHNENSIVQYIKSNNSYSTSFIYCNPSSSAPMAAPDPITHLWRERYSKHEFRSNISRIIKKKIV